MTKSTNFSNFLNKIQEPVLMLDNYGNKTVYECLIFGIADYLRITSYEEAKKFKLRIQEENELSKDSFSLVIIDTLIALFQNPKNENSENLHNKSASNSIVLDGLTNIFQKNMEAIKFKKSNISKTIQTKQMQNIDSFNEQIEMQKLLNESNSVFFFWYLLHQLEENKKNPNYNFFNIQKAYKQMSNINDGFKLQNFDEVKRSEDSQVFFVLSMIANFDNMNDYDDYRENFHLVGIYQENNKLKAYRYELSSNFSFTNLNFFDAVEMLAN